MKINIYVQPGAKKTSFEGKHGDAIKIKIKSPPLDGKANDELISFLSEKLKLKRSMLEIVSGERSRNKIIYIHNNELTLDEIIKKLN